MAFGRFPHSKGRLTEEDRVQVDAALVNARLSDLAKNEDLSRYIL